METTGVALVDAGAIVVVATTREGTRAALAVAVPLARGTQSKLTLLVPRIVPNPADLDARADATPFFVDGYEAEIRHLGGRAMIVVCVCRTVDDLVDGLRSHRGSVIIGGPVGRWLTSPEERVASRLVRAGVPVVFASSGENTTQRRMVASIATLMAVLASAVPARAQQAPALEWSYGAFVDVSATATDNAPANHLFRNRGTTPRVGEANLNLAGVYLRKPASEQSRLGVELTAQGGEDSKLFGFSATAPNIAGADALRHLGPANVSYLAPVGGGLTIQGGIFSSLIGYDSLYAKDNVAYTRPWGADYTPYLMLGVNASYAVAPNLTATAAIVNGYWHLANANSVPSVVGQIAYRPTDRISIKQTALYGPHQENTAIGFWRVLSDTIVERRTARLTTAFEYQFSAERVDSPASPEALWMSGQLPVHWTIAGPLSATVRPEVCWDSDGRWTGFPQRVLALTAGAEYRVPIRGAQAIVRGEYRVDDSRGSGGGFFAGADNHLVPTQNLFVVALMLTSEGTFRR